jgi:hypothetical protein
MVKWEEKCQNAHRKLKEAQDAANTDDAAEKKALTSSIMNRLAHAVSALEARAQQASVIIRVTAEGLGVTANKTILTTSQRLAEYVRVGQRVRAAAFVVDPTCSSLFCFYL